MKIAGRSPLIFRVTAYLLVVLVGVIEVSCADAPEGDSEPERYPWYDECVRNCPPNADCWCDPNRCFAETWPSYEDELRYPSCERAQPGAPWTCDCDDGSTSLVMNSDCEIALTLACDLSDEPDHCTSRFGGTCWPTEERETFECLCNSTGEEEDWRVGTGWSCENALENTCVQACEDETGRCTGPAGLVPAESTRGFSCECTEETDGAYPESSYPAATEVSCEDSLAFACGSACGTDAGTCRRDGDAYECSCSDGLTGSFVAPRTRSGCDWAVEEVCGRMLHPPGCDAGSWLNNCSGRPLVWREGDALPETMTFDCLCDGETWSVQESATCSGALETACPEAFEP